MVNKKIIIKFLGLIAILAIITGCGKDKTFLEQKNEEAKLETRENYREKHGFIEKENGWFYHFMITNFKGQNKTKHFFDGFNVKHKRLDDYNILSYENGILVDRFPTDPSLSISDKAKNKIPEREEVISINRYFDNKQFNRIINEEDLKDLHTENFVKKDIVESYNNAIDSVYLSEMQKFNLPLCSVIKEDTETENIQIGTVVIWGKITIIKIDVLYKNGNYLSDLISYKKANASQIKLYESFDIIEKYVVENQNVDVSNNFMQYNAKEYSRLFKLLKTLGSNEQ